MDPQVEHEFELPHSPGRVWRAFADGRERSQWEAATYEIEPREGGRVHWTLPGLACEGRVTLAVPERRLRHTEGSGPHSETEVDVTLEPVAAGTRVRVVHRGFGSGPEAELVVESVTLGWAQALADLRLFLDRGVPARRFVRAMHDPGMATRETPAGLEVASVVAGGFADRAGLRAGDYLLSVAGAPVFSLAELWVPMRQHAAGEKLTVEFLRGDEHHSGTAELA